MVHLDDALREVGADTARLSPDQRQRAERLLRESSMEHAATQAWERTRTGWQNDAANLDAATKADANKAMMTWGSDRLIEFLHSTGLAYHPELIRFAASAGRRLMEPAESTDAAPAGKPLHRERTPEQLAAAYPSTVAEPTNRSTGTEPTRDSILAARYPSMH